MRFAGRAIEAGRLEAEAQAPNPVEPLVNPLDDFDRPLDLLQERARLSYGSLTRIETKTSTLFAGTIAVLGFVLSHESTPIELLVVLLYLIPLAILMQALLGARRYSIVPDANTLAQSWPYYPKATVEAVFGATMFMVEEVAESVGLAAKRFRRATIWLYCLTAFIIVVRLAETTLRSTGVVLPPPYAQLAGIASPAPVATTAQRTPVPTPTAVRAPTK